MLWKFNPRPPPPNVEGLLSHMRGIGWDRVDSRDITLCTSSKHRRRYQLKSAITKLNNRTPPLNYYATRLTIFLRMRKDDAIQNWREMPYLLHPDLPMEKNKTTLCFCFFFCYNRKLRNDLMSVMNNQSMIALTAGTSHSLQLCCKFHHVLHQREINRGMRPLIFSNVHGD